MISHFVNIRAKEFVLKRVLNIFLAALIVMLSAAAYAGNDTLQKNGDFQDGDENPTNWPAPKADGTITYPKDGDNRFMRLKVGEPGKMVMVYRMLFIKSDVKAIEFTCKARCEDVQPGEKSWFDGRVLIQFKNADGKELKPGAKPLVWRGTKKDWAEYSRTCKVPEGTKTIGVMYTLFNAKSGTLDFDDVSVKAVDEPAAEPKAELPLTDAPVIFAADVGAADAPVAVRPTRDQEKAAKLLAETGSLIVNGGFEKKDKNLDRPEGWGSEGKGVTFETEGENHFLRITAAKPGEMTMLFREIPVPAGVPALQLSWKYRLSDMKKGELPWYDARILIKAVDAANKAKDIGNPYASKNTDGKWIEKSTSFLIPEGTVKLQFMPCLFRVNSGTFDLDDLKLAVTDPAPLLAAQVQRDKEIKARYVPPEEPKKDKWPSMLHVQGNKLINAEGKEVWLQGVNAGGLETLPHDKQAIKSVVVAIDDWKSNCVRLPMNERFWFGRDPTQKDGGKEYREKIDQIITLAANRGAYLVLDLHRFRAPKEEHAEFWKDAAARYKDHPAVLFDLFNEPHDISWDVWQKGGFVGEKKGTDESAFLTAEEKKKNSGFESVGMQALVDAIRSTGAKNIVIAGGLGWAGDLSGVAKGYTLSDPNGNGVMYSWHQYNWHKGWDKTVLPAAEKYPIFVGEVGADIKKMDFIPKNIQEDPYTWVPDMLGFIQKYKLNWTGWCMHPKATPIMISDWTYTPTPFWGVFAKDALAGKQFEMKKMR